MSDVRLTATNPEDSSVVPVACNAKGELKLEEPIAPPEFDGNLDGDLTVSGAGSFAAGSAQIFSGGGAYFAETVDIASPATTGGIRLSAAGSALFTGDLGAATLSTSDSTSFASNKAGFTAEGYLWCTTRRGDTVILDATSNGLGTWVEYTPSRTSLDEKLESLRDESNTISQDLPETPTETP